MKTNFVQNKCKIQCRIEHNLQNSDAGYESVSIFHNNKMFITNAACAWKDKEHRVSLRKKGKPNV